MLATDNCYTTIVLYVLIHPLFSAMVLPRPPSSSNHIRRDQGQSNQKFYEDKTIQSFLQSSNVERPNTNDYRVLEIELQGHDDIDPTNLQNIVHAMLKEPDQIHNDTYPNPEVVPHSIFGVRDFGLTPNFKLKMFDEEKDILMNAPKLQNFDEKFYYLKSNRPKVYVNVRGHSGSFRKDSTSTTSNNDPIGFLRMRPHHQSQIDWKSERTKTTRLPKKYDHRIDVNRGDRKSLSRIEAKKLSRLASVYGFDDLSTTENSMVTSSELPKQIPAPPARISSRSLVVQTTPVQRYALRRTDILPGYSFSDV